MRLVKAAKASPHAKFYSLSTAYNSMQICLNVGNISFSLGFCCFKDISDKVTENDDVIMHEDVTCIMTSTSIYYVDYCL